MTTAIEKDTDMSNEPIYPLDEYYWHNDADEGLPVGRRRTVNHRLTPIFRALLDDPDGWGIQIIGESSSLPFRLEELPETHEQCDRFSLVPKRRTITVDNLPIPDGWKWTTNADGTWVCLLYTGTQDSDSAIEAIRRAMEGK